MESLAYVLIYLMKGKLPWQNIKAKTKHERYHKIMQTKMSTSSDVLCRYLPSEIINLMFS